jgi:hypothetical protein
MTNSEIRIGMICPPDHETFGVVGDRLEERGYTVELLEPGVDLPTTRLDALDPLVDKKVRWESLHALEYAYRTGIPAWNDYAASTVLLNRLSQLAALAAIGFPVSEVLTERPDGEYVAKGFLDIHEEPVLNGEGDLYQPLLPFDGRDQKYYAVDDGTGVHTAIVEFESKRFGERQSFGRGTVGPDVERRIQQLLRFTGARALGVDVVEVGGTPYAIDLNPATSFRRTGLEDALVESIADAAP